MKKFFNILTQPSTGAGIAGVASGVGFIGLGNLEVGISTILGSLFAIFKSEKST